MGALSFAERCAELRARLAREAPDARWAEASHDDGSYSFQIRAPRAILAFYVEAEPNDDGWHLVIRNHATEPDTMDLGEGFDGADVPALVRRVLA